MNTCKDNTAFIIKNICDIFGESPGKKILQKIIFLIEEKGIDLNYEYELHFYGPYSAKLDSETASLYLDGIINFNYYGRSHKMEINKDCKVSSELSNDDEKTVKEIIERFKDRSPSKLELLTTIIYAYNNLEDKTRNSVINGVKKIKGEKYTEEEINGTLKDLEYFDKAI